MIQQTPITQEALLALGFAVIIDDSHFPRFYYCKSGIGVWQHGEYWLIDILNQANLHVEFQTMEHLAEFYAVCRQPFNLDYSEFA